MADTQQSTRSGGLRAALARRVDTFVLQRARVLADRAARGKYSEAKAKQIHETLGALSASSTPTPDAVEAVAKAYEQLYDKKKGTILPNKRLRQATIDQFHRIYYHTPKSTWQNTFYRGVKIWKCPLDVWLYQEMIHELKPDLIIETGTAFGGSAYYLGDLCETVGKGEVVSIDIQDRTDGLKHPKVDFIIGSSVDPLIKQRVVERIPEGGTTLLILDSDHSRKHVLEEMRLWHDVVTPGSYMIVEDSNINGHPVRTFSGPGPWEAIDDFMKENEDFEIDESKHKFFMTQNPRGYLRRKK